MNGTALLIIDMQLGNFSEPDPIYNGDELLEKVKSLITKARSAQTPIIYIKNNGGSGDPDEYGTPGWEIHPSMAPVEGDIVVQKKTPDAFHETNLHRELESRGIRKLVIAGLQTEYCIDTTCRRASSLGYDVTLVSEQYLGFSAFHCKANHRTSQPRFGWMVCHLEKRERNRILIHACLYFKAS